MSIAPEYKEMLDRERMEEPDTISHTIYQNRKIKLDKRYHLRETQHNDYINTGKQCPWCLGGSIPETREENQIRLRNEKLIE